MITYLYFANLRESRMSVGAVQQNFMSISGDQGKQVFTN